MAEIMAAFFASVAALPHIEEYVVTPIKNQFSSLFCYDKLIQNLRVQVESLDKQKTFLQRQVEAERRNLKDINPAVLESLKRAEEIKRVSEKIIGAVPEDQNVAVPEDQNGAVPEDQNVAVPEDQNVAVPEDQNGAVPEDQNVAVKLTELTAAVVELVKKLETFSKAYPPPLREIETIPPPSGTQEFQSRKEKKREIMACLRDDTIFMIGVCGMGGVGKTTMAKNICRMASEEKLFDEIVMTQGLGQDADQLKIQQQLAGGLGLELTKDTRTNCSMLLQRLTGKKVLLVLDDVWERLDLQQLGISSQSMNKGSKIILTTRNDRDCIESTDDATEIIKLEVLREEEALSLFRDKAGSVVDQDDLHELATNVAAECKGLPLALVTVGSALKQQTDKAIWEDALLQLQHAAQQTFVEF